MSNQVTVKADIPQTVNYQSCTVQAGTTTTLASDQNATVTNSGTVYNAVLDFGIPRGKSAYEQAVEGGYQGTEEEFNAAIGTDVQTVSTNISDVTAVGQNIADVTAVSDKLTDIATVASNTTDISTVAGISSDVSSVSSISTAVSNVAANETAVLNVSDNLANVNTIASNMNSVLATAADISNINTVAGDKTNVDTVATNISNVNTAATNMAAIIAAPTAAQNAATSATNAQTWAEGTDSAITALGGEHSSKGWAGIAKQYAESIGTALKYKGSVASYSALPSTGQEVGDMWNVLDTGKNYAWAGTEWDDLAGVVDLSAYRTAANQDIIDGNLSTTITNHTSNTSNPHSVTATQVGLGNCDNTSDLNKPISTATQTALDGKQATLVSGTNIKTVNNNSLLGSGDITIDSLPSQTGQSGKFLTTDGTDASWANVDALPSQTGQSGKFLTTDGTDASWANVDALPSQTGQSGKFLTTDGANASWSTIPAGVSADGTTIENVSDVFTTIGVKDQKTANANKFWTGTKAEYDAIVTKDPNTTYRTTDEYESGGGSYTLPPATASTLGGVKVGSGLSVQSDGTLSTSGDIPSGIYTEDNLVAGQNISMVKSFSVEQASDFDQGYLQTIIDKNPTTSLDVVLHFKTPSSPSGSGGRITNIFMAGGSTGIHFQQYQYSSEPIRMWLYGNGQTICSDVNFAGPIAANTDAWFRLTWDGATYNTYAKTNELDNWVLQNTVSSSIPVYFGGNYTAFGSYVNGSSIGNLAEGIFYAEDSYIKVDNEYVFNGVQNNFEINGNLTVVGSYKTFINGTGADTLLSNLTDAGKIVAAKMSMPSGTYDNLTLGASGATYTAPANGWFFLQKVASGGGEYIQIVNQTSGAIDFSNASGPYGLTSLVPAQKGDIVEVYYTASSTVLNFRFIYAEGSKSEQ